MSDLLQEVQRLRTTADELLAIARSLANEIARDALLDLAEGYHRLADQLEGLEIKRRARKPGA